MGRRICVNWENIEKCNGLEWNYLSFSDKKEKSGVSNEVTKILTAKALFPFVAASAASCCVFVKTICVIWQKEWEVH